MQGGYFDKTWACFGALPILVAGALVNALIKRAVALRSWSVRMCQILLEQFGCAIDSAIVGDVCSAVFGNVVLPPPSREQT
jgi:hypothetical protein